VTEQLIIRLGSEANDPILWLVWSRSHQEVIASGELAGSGQLSQLKERAGGRPVLVLVPSLDVTLRSVALPGKANRQLLKALPYLLEDELCEDVEQLHLALLGMEGQQAQVAVVAHSRMRAWLGWLAEAGLTPQRLLPDVLALPRPDDSWQALELEGQWLIRTGPYSGYSIDADWLGITLQQTAATEQLILSYSQPPAQAPGQWRCELTELPMQLLAEGALGSGVSLLSGPYLPTREWRKYVRPVVKVGIASAVCLLLLLTNRYLAIRTLEAQQLQLNQHSQAIYRKLFPDERRVVNLRAQLERHVKTLSGGTQAEGLLPMLAELRPVFAGVPSLKPASLRYDDDRGELRIQAVADSFQSFEQLRSQTPAGWVIEQGALTQQGQQVSGSMTFRRAS